MDYLSGKQNSQPPVVKYDKHDSTSQIETIFPEFCEELFSCLTLDEMAAIGDKYISEDITTVLKDNELIDCINAFFKNNLNISETSRNAFLHRNTLLYRIEKIYKTTGLNIRNFEDAMIFKLLSIIYFKISDIARTDDEN